MKLIDNNGETVCRGTKKQLLAYAVRQYDFDPTYALWLVMPDGTVKRMVWIGGER
jgi:hypothetical protein